MSNRTTFRFIYPVNVPGQSNWVTSLTVSDEEWSSTEDGVQITNPHGHVIVFDHNIVCITTQDDLPPAGNTP